MKNNGNTNNHNIRREKRRWRKRGRKWRRGKTNRRQKQQKENENSGKALGQVPRIKKKKKKNNQRTRMLIFASENSATFNDFAYDQFFKPRWVGGIVTTNTYFHIVLNFRKIFKCTSKINK